MKTRTSIRIAILWLLMLSLPLTHGQAPEPSPAPPPAGSAPLSQADLEKLLGPIALYPDSLIATVLTASVYPLEIVQAARFVQNPDNLAKLDEQPWDANVKAVARVPDAIKKMNDDLDWTTQLGKVFLAQQKEVMDTIQSLRLKAQKTGTLKTTEQQTVVVTNMVVETTIEERVVVVTNTVVQIQPTNPQVVYVPTYDPYLAYYPPYGVAAPIMTFAAGVAVGAIIANNCDWHGGYVNHHSDVNINVNNNNNVNINSDRSNTSINNKSGQSKGSQKWQPDQSRLQSSGAPGAAQSAQARGWSDSGAKPSTSNAAKTGATQGGQGGRSPSAQPQPAANTRQPSQPSANTRPASQPSANTRQASPQPAASTASRSQASPSAGGKSQDSAFSGGSSGSAQRAESQRGASSRASSGGGGGGGRSAGGGGGGRGGGGGGGRR